MGFIELLRCMRRAGDGSSSLSSQMSDSRSRTLTERECFLDADDGVRPERLERLLRRLLERDADADDAGERMRVGMVELAYLRGL